MRDDIIYLKLLLAVCVARWNLLPVYWQLKDKKKVSVNNLLEHRGVTKIYTTHIYMHICMCVYVSTYIYIYIYICVYVCVCVCVCVCKLCTFVLFEVETIEVSSWCRLSMLLDFRRVRLLLEKL